MYATGGSERLTPAVWVDIVKSVVTPNETLAGTDCVTRNWMKNFKKNRIDKMSKYFNMIYIRYIIQDCNLLAFNKPLSPAKKKPRKQSQAYRMEHKWLTGNRKIPFWREGLHEGSCTLLKSKKG